METKNFCQSCSMPLDNESVLGTEKDGSKSKDYCKYCYQNGAFTSPGMTIDEMSTIVRSEMVKRNIPSTIIAEAVKMLPALKRWRKSNVPV